MSIFRRFLGVLTIAFCCAFATHTAMARTITLSPNGGTACAQTTIEVTNGVVVPPISCAPTREGYFFLGYYADFSQPSSQVAYGFTDRFYNHDLSRWAIWDDNNGVSYLKAQWIQEPKFFITTVSGYDGKTARININADGFFLVDWGDGEVSARRTEHQSTTTLEHTYDAQVPHVIGIGGKATGYKDYSTIVPNDGLDDTSYPSIWFGKLYSDSGISAITNRFTASIDGTLGEVFPTIGLGGAGQQPSFAYTFKSGTHLSGAIPENLFNGVHGQLNKYMFLKTFAYNTGLTGTIPAHLFGGTMGVAQGAFAGTFDGVTNMSCSIPDTLFQTVIGDVAPWMFDTTFRNFCSNTGNSSITIHPNLFSAYRLSGLPFSNEQMDQTFQNSGLLTSCPTGYVQYVTGFENYWSNRKACVPSNMTLTVDCGTGYGTGTVIPVQYEDYINVNHPTDWGCTAPSNATFSHWAVSNNSNTYTAGQGFWWRFVESKVFTAVWEDEIFAFQLNPHGGSSSLNTLYEKYGVGWATSANPSSWNLEIIDAPVRNGWSFRGYFDHEIADAGGYSLETGVRIRNYNNGSQGYVADTGNFNYAPGATWYAAWARNCAPTAPATCFMNNYVYILYPDMYPDPDARASKVEYITHCPVGYNINNQGKYNPSCTPKVVTIDLDNNNATSAGSTGLRAKFGNGVYLDPDAVSNLMTPQSQNGGSNPITKPQKQFTVTYYAQGGAIGALNNDSTTATFTFTGYYYSENNNAPVQVIDDDGYITTNGDTIGKAYTTNATWTAQWSGGSVTLPNATRPGYTLASWRTAANCGGSVAGTPGQSYTPDGNIALYACWTDVPYYTITLSDGSYNDITQHGYIASTGNNQCTTAGMKYGDGWLNICNATPQAGDTLNLRQVPKRPNHVFNGYWAELAGGAAGVDKPVVTPTGEFLETDEVIHGFTSNSSIVASWAPKYLITLNPNDGSGGDASVYEGYGIGWSKTQNGDYTETSIIAPSRTGYTFAGFWSDPNAGVRYIRSNGTLPDPDTFTSARTLYAHWTPKTYTITLNDNGGSGGQVGDADSHCNKAGLVYGVGWKNICDTGTGSGGGGGSDRGATGDGDSKKTEDSGDSGDGDRSATGTTGTGTSQLRLYVIPTPPSGYRFKGYYTTASGGGDVMIVTPSGAFLNANLTFTNTDAQIYARWEQGDPSNTIYTISLDANNNGLDGNVRPPKIYQKNGFWADSTANTNLIVFSIFDPIADGGGGISQPAPPSGKVFNGYWDARMSQRVIDENGNIFVEDTYFARDTTVSAIWADAATTTVTLNPNGGTACAVTSVTATQGQPMPNLTCAPAPPTGYDFTGYWNTQYGGYPQYYDSDLNSASNWNQTGSSATIYDGYTPAERHIMYRCGAAFGAFSLSQAVTYGDQYTIANMADVGCNAVSGKKFIGWTDAGTGTFFEPGQTISNWPYYTDMILDATYLDVFTVTLSSSGATNNPSPTVVYIVPYTQNSNGHEGWYSYSTGDTPITRMQTRPERPFYAFAGYTYQGTGETSGNTIDIIDSSGVFSQEVGVLRKITASGTANAIWTPLAPEFTVTTTPLSANTTFKFYIGAAGSFMVNWGDGNTQVVSSPGEVSHTYSSANTYTIGISGDATGYIGTYRTETIYNTAQVVESTQWSNNDVRPTQLNFPSAIRFGCEAEDSSCTLTPTLVAAVSGSLGNVFPTLGDGNTQQPRFSRTFAGCTNLTDVPEDLFGGVYGAAIPGMFYGTFEDSGLVSVGQNLFSGITSFAPHAFQRTFMGSDLSTVPAGLFSHISGAPAEAVFAYTFANTQLQSIPSGIFGGVAGAPAIDMFWGTFSGVPFVYGNTLPALFSGISGAPAKGMFDSTFYNSYNLTGTIPANLFGGTNLSGVPAERMFASTFYGCYGLNSSIPANLFGGTNLTGASAVSMFDSTFYNCIGMWGYVPPTLFGGISTSNPATNMMNNVFANSGIWQQCICGTHNYTTGFESYWNGRVSCEIGLKSNEHWYGNICVEDCEAGITQLKTSLGLSFQILKSKPSTSEHAIYISAPTDGTVCYVPLDSGSGGAGSMNVRYSGTTYHLGFVTDTAPANWDPLASS